MNVGKELAALRRTSVDDLRSRYAEVFGKTTNGRHKDWLIKRIIYRLQVLAEGDLSEWARRRRVLRIDPLKLAGPLLFAVSLNDTRDAFFAGLLLTYRPNAPKWTVRAEWGRRLACADLLRARADDAALGRGRGVPWPRGAEN